MTTLALNTAYVQAGSFGPTNSERLGAGLQSSAGASDAAQVREAFTQFVGETFFSQMIKAMRTSTGKPAYFHGGQAEEVFRGQLDQTMAEEMTKGSADRVARPMFEHQFPQLAALLEKEPPEAASPGLSVLDQLRRR